MTDVVSRVVRGRYLDSVSLMRISQSLSALDGVVEAAVMIGSDTNKRLMRDSGLLGAEAEAAQPADLIVGVRAENEGAARAALAAVDALLSKRATHAAGGAVEHARTLAGATKALPGANVALISVPGEFAAAEAAKALRAGLNVLLFSNNVSLDDEVALKQLARERGLLLMGPDCGTSLVNGVPLAFANVVPRGSVGVIAASGTGLQEVTTLVAHGGGGISHGIGVGGRDLRDEIGGITTLMALDALDADAATTHVVVISKPPAPRVANAVLERIAKSAKRFTICLLGQADIALPSNARRAHTLREAAELALGVRFAPDFVARTALPQNRRGNRVRGLYCGGTLCAEAQLVLLGAGEPVASNAPVPGARAIDGAMQDRSHSIVDLGADEYTRGRPHPMIEPAIRSEPLRAAMTDSATAAVLLDVVIGYGAHPDPAGVLVDAVGSIPSQRPPIIASVCGTEGDPQVYSRQVRTLESAGIIVAPSNAHAAEFAVRVLHSR
ncbi:MAG TPA: acyl-CoA synthetase FdrA [Casimicrobiaceae bacterium]